MQKFPNYQELFRELFNVTFFKKFPIIEFGAHKEFIDKKIYPTRITYWNHLFFRLIHI